MMDLLQKRSEVEGKDDQRKSCTDCHITRTPLWRRGPYGTKTLCNTCGIKYNKNRRQHLGLERRGKQRVNNKKQKNKKKKSDNEMGKSLKMRLAASGREMGLKISADLREEEEAAILLMALSCGFLSSMLD